MAGYIGNKSAVVSSGAERKKTFAITTTTTSLTGLSYTPNFVHVFHNGIRLVDGTDYTATNGSTITLTNAAENGDEVVVVSYGTFTPADAYTKAEADDRYVNAAGDTMTGDLVVAQGTSLVKSFANNTEEYLIRGTDQAAYQPYISHTPSYDTPDRGIRMGIWDNNGTKTDWLKIWNGHVTMPYQPAFDVSYSPTGYSAAGVVVFDTVFVNIGSHYSTSTGRFTAPVSGSYLFYTTYIKANSTTVSRRRFNKNGLIYGGSGSGRHLRLDDGQAYGDNGVLQAIIYLNAGDYVEVDHFAGSSYGTLEYDYFGGYLIG